MVSTAAFGAGDPGSNPGWFAVLNSNQKLSFYSRTIQACDLATLIVITLTLSSLVGGDE